MGNDNSIPLNMILNVGDNVNQILRRERRFLGEDKLEKFELSYYLGINRVVVQLLCETTNDRDGLTRLARFKIDKPGLINFSFFIERTENNLLELTFNQESKEEGLKGFSNKSKDPSGELTKTFVMYHGSDDERFLPTEGSLVVMEVKKKRRQKNPYVVTIAHYYANYSEGLFGWRKYDAGLSVIVNIRVVNNNMDFVWKISHKNSSRALLPMFQQVCRTQTWKWMTCPYRAAEARRINTETGTESEEDEEGSYVQITKQIGSNVLANQGAIRGNNNGNLVVKNLYLRGRN